MNNWRVEVTAGGESSAEVKIKGGIFLEGAVSPLLFVTKKKSEPSEERKLYVLSKFVGGYKLTKS